MKCQNCGKEFDQQYPHCPWCGEQATIQSDTSDPPAEANTPFADKEPSMSDIYKTIVPPAKKQMSTGVVAVITCSIFLVVLVFVGFMVQNTALTGSRSSSSIYGFASSKVSSRESIPESKPSLLEQREKCASLISVSKVSVDKPNSAGGVDLHIEWTNKADKTIKYITFTVLPYNAVDDVVKCEIRGLSAAGCQVTGPVKPGASYGSDYRWECVWYNNTITWARLGAIEIEYMDGTKEAFAGQELSEACPRYFCNYTPYF